MEARRAAEAFPPGEYLRDELEARAWSQSQLAELLGVPLQIVGAVIAAERRVSPELARGLAAALGTSPELWLNLESAYRLCGD